MSAFLSREDVAAVPERSSVNAGFAWEGSKQSVAFSETPVPPASEPSPSHDFGASSLSSEEEQVAAAAPSLPASEEDLRCGRGVCMAMEEDLELSELELPASPATPPQQPREGEEEEVAEDGEDRFAFRKLNRECHDSEIDNGLPAVIRCFQVVSPSAAPHTPSQLGSGNPNTAASRYLGPRGVVFAWLGLCLELISRSISHSQCTPAPLHLSSRQI